MADPTTTPQPPDGKPWTQAEIRAAQFVNAVEDLSNSLNGLVRAWEESNRRDAAERAARQERQRQRFALLRRAVREGTVTREPS